VAVTRSAIPDQDLSGVFRGQAVDWQVLGESCQHGGLLPGRSGQRAIDRDVHIQARDADGELAGPPVIDGAGGALRRVFRSVRGLSPTMAVPTASAATPMRERSTRYGNPARISKTATSYVHTVNAIRRPSGDHAG
jgi:hypothetical protein